MIHVGIPNWGPLGIKLRDSKAEDVEEDKFCLSLQ
jgi:hypothetical protein